MREPSAFWDDLNEDLKNPEFRAAYEAATAELAECDCGLLSCGYEPADCPHCELYGHACHGLCAEEGCPCHA